MFHQLTRVIHGVARISDSKFQIPSSEEPRLIAPRAIKSSTGAKEIFKAILIPCVPYACSGDKLRTDECRFPYICFLIAYHLN